MGGRIWLGEPSVCCVCGVDRIAELEAQIREKKRASMSGEQRLESPRRFRLKALPVTAAAGALGGLGMHSPLRTGPAPTPVLHGDAHASPPDPR